MYIFIDFKAMYYTYILESLANSNHFYIGSTSDLKRRLSEHNSGKSIHTNKFTPWKIKNYIASEMQEQAEKFERFLKSGNGRIFSKKHFLSPNLQFMLTFLSKI